MLHSAGYTAAQLFGQGVTYTYDDVIFLPGHIDFGAHEVPSPPRLLLQRFALFKCACFQRQPASPDIRARPAVQCGVTQRVASG